MGSLGVWLGSAKGEQGQATVGLREEEERWANLSPEPPPAGTLQASLDSQMDGDNLSLAGCFL